MPVQPGYQAVDVAMGTVIFPHLAHDQGHLLGYRRQDAVFDKRSAARSITHMGIWASLSSTYGCYPLVLMGGTRPRKSLLSCMALQDAVYLLQQARLHDNAPLS